MKPQLPLPCLFLPAWCSASLQDDLQVSWSDGQRAAQLPLREALATLKGRTIALIIFMRLLLWARRLVGDAVLDDHGFQFVRQLHR